MSAQASSWVWESGPNNPLQRFLLLAMAECTDELGFIKVSDEFLMRRTAMTYAQVERIKVMLVEEGILKAEWNKHFKESQLRFTALSET